MEHILDVEHLKMYYFGKTETVRAVDDVSFHAEKGETFGIVGESGCGKSSLAKTVIGLNQPTSGHSYFNGEDLTGLSRKERREELTVHKVCPPPSPAVSASGSALPGPWP